MLYFYSAGNNFHVGSSSFELVALKDANGQQLPPIISLAAGARHALLVAQDLRLWAFGDNLAGQCGVPGHQTRLNTPKVREMNLQLWNPWSACEALSTRGPPVLREGLDTLFR